MSSLDTLRVIASLSVLAAGFAIPQLGVFGAGQMLAGWGGMAGAAAVLGGSLLVNAAIPAQNNKINASPGAPSYALSGMRNRMPSLYDPIMQVFGQHRVYPPYAAKVYTETSGHDQWLRCMFVLKGKYALSDHKIGDTAIGAYDGVYMETYYSGGGNNFYGLYPSSVDEQFLSVELTQAAGWQTRTTAENTDEISAVITLPDGLYDISSDGDRNAESVTFEAEYAVAGSGTWLPLAVCKDFNFSGYPSTSIAQGMSVVGQTTGAQGTITYAHKTLKSIPTGDNDSDGHPIYAWVQYVDRVRVQVTSGVFTTEILLIGGSHSATISSISDSSGVLAMNGEHHFAYRIGINLNVPRGQYDVRIRRTTDDDRENSVDASIWTALRSITHEEVWSLAGCTLIALRIKASGQLNGVIDQYNCIAQRILPAHDGYGWNEVATRSPAWAHCEVLRGSSNERPVADASINIAAHRTWAANCAAAGRNYDAVIDYRTTVDELRRDICAVGRAQPARVNHVYTVIEDIERAVSGHFNQHNCYGLTASGSFPDRPHALRIRFFDAANDYIMSERVVYDDGYSSSNATRYENMELIGATDADQVWKWGRYWIACLRLRPERFEFTAYMQNLRHTRGDRVIINHATLSVGVGSGRIRSITVEGGYITAVAFDDIFPMETGKNYAFRYWTAAGVDGTASVVTVIGDNTSVTLSPAIPTSTGLGAGDLCSFGETDDESIDVIIQEIAHGDEFSARIAAIPYAPDVFTADGSTIPSYDPGITMPPVDNRQPPKPNIVSTSYSYKDGVLNDDGTYAVWFVVVFEAAQSMFSSVSASPTAPDVIQGFQAQWRFVDGQWQELPLLAANARQFGMRALNNHTYDVRIRSYSLPGLYSDWDAESNIPVALSGTVPSDVSGLQIAGGGNQFFNRDCAIEWTEVSGGGTAGTLIKDYKIEVRTSDGLTTLRTEYTVYPRYVYTYIYNMADGGPRPALQFRVWARSRWGDLSVNYASLSATNPAPVNPQGLGAHSHMGGVEFYWNQPSNWSVTDTGIIADDSSVLTGQDGSHITGGSYTEGNITEEDFSHFEYRLRLSLTGTWGEWTKTLRNGVYYTLSAANRETYGADAAVYIEVKSIDMFEQASATSATFEICGNLNVKETDIDDFAVSASKIFTKIPVVQGLMLAHNTPTTGSIAWSACMLYYNGVGYSIATGNTDQKYIYWKDFASAFATSFSHPSELSDWQPGEDFIIAVNISGIGQQAWNALANQVIGSAYIMELGVNDAHIASLSGTKIDATTSVSIGGQTWASQGIQLQYNNGTPRFYAGDGANNWIAFDGSTVGISTSKASALVIKNGGDIVIESGGDMVLQAGGNIEVYGSGSIGWYDSSSNLIGKITSNYASTIDLMPASSTGKGLVFGTYDNSYKWQVIYFYAYQNISILSTYDASNCALVNVVSGGSSYVELSAKQSNTSYTIALQNYYGTPTLRPATNNQINVGTAALAYATLYYYNLSDVGDYFHLDDHDDIALLKQIKGSGRFDQSTKLELVDDDTLPEIILSKNKKGEIERNTSDNNKPYISHKALFSLLMGACRQLDARIDKIEERLNA
jgi:hypothetical protein